MKFEELSLETPEQEAIRLGGDVKKDVSNAEVVAENVTKENLELNQEMPATKIESPVVIKETVATEKNIDVLKSEQQAVDMRKETAVIEKIANHGQEKADDEPKKITPETNPTGFLNQEITATGSSDHKLTGREYLNNALGGRTYYGEKTVEYAELCEKVAAEKAFAEKFSGNLNEDETKKSEKTMQKLEVQREKMIKNLEKQGFPEQEIQRIQELSDAKGRENVEQNLSDYARLSGSVSGESSKDIDDRYVSSFRNKKEDTAKKGRIAATAGAALTALGGSTISGALAIAPALAFPPAGLAIMGTGFLGYGAYKMWKGWKAKRQSLAQFNLDAKKGKYNDAF